jgi:hypothetical protein
MNLTVLEHHKQNERVNKAVSSKQERAALLPDYRSFIPLQYSANPKSSNNRFGDELSSVD